MSTRTSRLRTSVRIAVVAAASVLTLTVAQSANASSLTPTGKAVISKNSDVTGRCALTVQSVDSITGNTHVKLGAQAQPTTLAGYFNNVFTQMNCSVYDATGSVLLGGYHPSANNSVLYASSVQLTLPFGSSYVLCGQAFTKLANGVNSLAPFVCG